MTENEIAKIIVDTAYKIHTQLGSGLLESAYQAIMVHELKKRGLRVEQEVPIPIVYDKIILEVGYRADILVEKSVLVELKSIEKTTDVHKKQLLTYLRIANLRLGLLINFGGSILKGDITRIVNGLPE